MSNKEIAKQFDLLGKLLEVHGENSFKARAYFNTAFQIKQLAVNLEDLSIDKLEDLPGIGQKMAVKIEEIFTTGTMQETKELWHKTPEGIRQLLPVKGLGAKKIHDIWKKLNITAPGELLQACKQNQLLKLKGFGAKTQENIQLVVEYFMMHQGAYLYAEAENILHSLQTEAKLLFGHELQVTGEYRRQLDTIRQIEFVLPYSAPKIAERLSKNQQFENIIEDAEVRCTFRDLQLVFYPQDFTINTLLHTTGSIPFLEALQTAFPNATQKAFESEQAFFESNNLQYIPPFLREHPNILLRASEENIPEVVQEKDIRGLIHCHSNWSDGIQTIEQLTNECIRLGFDYLVLSDHSKSAFYANGLDDSRVLAQQEVIDQINAKVKPFHIFKSIESDILSSGELDYKPEVLSTFDIVIASVHSNLQMNLSKATDRLLKAIHNPFTSILGHPTGRLLLSRAGYPIDHKTIIDACAANHVVIEINANPRRLDMRWEWISYAIEQGVLLSINPDAHSIDDFSKLRYGILHAQKGMLTPADNLSSFGLPEFKTWVAAQQRKRPKP